MYFSYFQKFAAKLQKIFDMCKYPKLAFFIFFVEKLTQM